MSESKFNTQPEMVWRLTKHKERQKEIFCDNQLPNNFIYKELSQSGNSKELIEEITAEDLTRHIAKHLHNKATEDKEKGSIDWNLFKNKFARSSTHAKIVAFNKSNNIKFNDATTFVNDVRGAIYRLCATGLNMDSECLSLLILQ
ncbi:hypothetical protein BY996DRAFT_6560555 [Phakopsora pachyrhizi]|nr:hypothetical protein BY996DRAFT_6560555 [Phakopsora pachyrhizi]